MRPLALLAADDVPPILAAKESVGEELPPPELNVTDAESVPFCEWTIELPTQSHLTELIFGDWVDPAAPTPDGETDESASSLRPEESVRTTPESTVLNEALEDPALVPMEKWIGCCVTSPVPSETDTTVAMNDAALFVSDRPPAERSITSSTPSKSNPGRPLIAESV